MPLTSAPIRIALADDHGMLRKSLISCLNAVDDFVVVCEGNNGQELLDAIQVCQIKPQVCLLDVSMPVMNGYDTLVELKRLMPDLLVLILTMIDHQGNFLRMIHAGANGYMLKDEEPEELIRGIRFLAEHGFYNSPNATKLPSLVSRKYLKSLAFSAREQQFLKLIASELSYKEIASLMGVSEKTVEGCRRNLFERLSVKSRTGLAFYALQTGLVQLNDYGEK